MNKKNLVGLIILCTCLSTLMADPFCIDDANKGIANGTYLYKKNGIPIEKYQLTGERTYILVEKIDLNDGSVIASEAWTWKVVTPPNVAFVSAPNPHNCFTQTIMPAPQRVLEAVRQNNGDIIVKAFNKDCIEITSEQQTWEKQ